MKEIIETKYIQDTPTIIMVLIKRLCSMAGVRIVESISKKHTIFTGGKE